MGTQEICTRMSVYVCVGGAGDCRVKGNNTRSRVASVTKMSVSLQAPYPMRKEPLPPCATQIARGKIDVLSPHCTPTLRVSAYRTSARSLSLCLLAQRTIASQARPATLHQRTWLYSAMLRGGSGVALNAF